jgi:hypothetical protein
MIYIANYKTVSRETLRYIRLVCSFVIIFSVFNGCGEDTILQDVSAFNKIIEGNTEMKTPEDVMKAYYRYLRNEEQSGYTLTAEKLPRHRFLVTMIRENMRNDSMKEEKFTMMVEKKDKEWKVITVERNWKCYSESGHTDWGTQLCK